MSRFAQVVLATLISMPISAASAEEGRSFSVGRIDSAKTCTLYQQSAGKSGVIITPYAIAAYSSWRTWLVRDCIDNFAGIRNALETALAASGGIALRSTGGQYIVSGRISEVSGGSSPAPEAPSVGQGGFSIATNNMRVVIDVTVRDRAGRIVFGVPLVKTIETGADVQTGDFRTTSNEAGEALYSRLQQEVALGVARAVVFHFSPLQVTSVAGRQVRLNYGMPLLKLGTIVQVTAPDGAATMRYGVTSADGGMALARLVGSGDPSRILIGSSAIVIEADDPAANARRYERVELP